MVPLLQADLYQAGNPSPQERARFLLRARWCAAYRRTGTRPIKAPHVSELAAAARVEDDLGHVVHAQPQLLGYLVRPQTLLVVQQRQLLLRPAPRLADHLGSGGPRP